MSTTSDKQYTKGGDLKACRITPIVDNGDGTYTLGTAVSIKGYVDNIDLQITQATDMVLDINGGQENFIPLYHGFRLSITEIKRRRWQASTSTNPNGTTLPWFAANYSLAMIEFTQCTVNGGASTGETYRCYGCWENLGDGSRGLGSQRTTLNFVPHEFTDSVSGALPIVNLDTTSLA